MKCIPHVCFWYWCDFGHQISLVGDPEALERAGRQENRRNQRIGEASAEHLEAGRDLACSFSCHSPIICLTLLPTKG